jgi:tetratricopeptide (TPR) repeat protein
MFVGWKALGTGEVSRAETVGMGGLFLYSAKPPVVGSFIELVFQLKTGEVRARAVVRHSCPGKGMGVQFVEMQTGDRARLNQLLAQCPPMNTDEEMAAQRCGGAAAGASAPASDAASREAAEAVQFEREFAEKLDLARKGTYYQLLGVTSESPAKQIKQGFYALARKFHPDRHMSRPEWLAALKELMGVVSAAYETLSDEEKRAAYDEQLESSGAFNLRRSKTAMQKNIEECFAHVTECLRAQNFAGSIVWLRKCVEMAPDDPKYHALLANSLGTIPQYHNEAVRQYERAIELDPFNARVMHQFAELFEEMELPSRARLLYSKILEIDPSHAKARERLAQRKA